MDASGILPGRNWAARGDGFLLATDFSVGARRAASRILLLPLAESAAVEPLHVVSGTGEIDAMMNERDALTSALRRANRSDVRVTPLVRPGTPAREILSLERERACDLVVLGKHGASMHT